MLRALVYLVVPFLLCSAIAEDVVVRKQKLFVGTDQYFVKGLLYNPVPLGQYRMTPDGVNGGGLCSLKLTPYGEKKSACYDFDYFDGSIDSGSSSLPSPSGSGWFEQAWKRDFPLIREAGFNTLRILYANPITKVASENAFGRFGIRSPTGKDHVRFMDLAHQYGFKVIFPLFANITKMKTVSDEEYAFYIRNQIDEVGNHPALLLFSFGNEDAQLISNGTVSSILENSAATANSLEISLSRKWLSYARMYQQTKWYRKVPFTTYWPREVSQNIRAVISAVNFPLEVHSVRFSLSAAAEQQTIWNDISALTCKTGAAVLISGMGADDVAIRQQSSAAWINQEIKQVWTQLQSGVVGGVFNEWNDEPLQTAEFSDLGIVRYEVAKTPQGANSLQTSIWLPDVINRKETQFSAAAYGTLSEDGVAWNFRADPFELLNLTRAKLSEETESASLCSSAPQISSVGNAGVVSLLTTAQPLRTYTLPSWPNPDSYISDALTITSIPLLVYPILVVIYLMF